MVANRKSFLMRPFLLLSPHPVLSAFVLLCLWNGKLVNLPTGIYLAFGFFLPVDGTAEMTQTYSNNKAHALLTFLSLLVHLTFNPMLK